MQAQSLAKLDRRIRHIQQALAALGPMRPGTLTRQYRQPQQRRGAYYQLSYTFQMRSRTEYVRAEELAQVRREVAQYRRYKRLNAQWVALALQRAQLRVRLARGGAQFQRPPARSPAHP